MSVLLEASNHGTLGIQPNPLILSCRNKDSSAIAQWALVRLDFAQTSEEPGTGSSALGSASNSKWANVTLAPTTTAASSGGIYGVAQEAIAAGANGKVMFAGITQATSTSLTYAVGEAVGLTGSAITAGNVSNATVTTKIGIFVGTAGASTAPRILLNGVIAFGT
jgi:hypothetical protein